MAKAAVEVGRLRSIHMDDLGKAMLDVANQHSPPELLRAMCDLVIAGAYRGGRIEINEANGAERAALKLLPLYEHAVRENPPCADLLGPLYMVFASRWARQGLGQYFTPANVCEAMARMTLGDPLAEISKRKPGDLLRVCDPTVGSGAMILAAERYILESGREAVEHYSFTGIDLDPICARMFAVQQIVANSLHNVRPGELVAICGDGLLPPGDPSHKLLLWAEHPRWVAARLPRPTSTPTPRPLGEAPPEAPQLERYEAALIGGK